ncbi:MAG: hypothetical protein P4L10_11790 [Acidobacteriaceae bacterium]|nr:hypothetical protein [Acidobacteriaceae bacterium]
MKPALRMLIAIVFVMGAPALLCGQGKGGSASITPVAAAADAGFGALDPTPPTGMTAEQVIAKFAARESEFDDARRDYGFRQNVRVQTLDDDKKVDGEYQETTDISFTRDGKRVETVVFAPANSLTKITMSQQDFSDIEHRLPFVLTTADLPDYNITYLGRQKVDEVDTYVFQAGPKVMEKGRRYFQGKVWVDQQDSQIVLIDGRSVPDDVRKGHEDLSPPYTTYYEQVDGDYWFPTYTKGEGMLNFSGGSGYLSQSVHIRQIITYSNYKRFRSRSRVIYNGQEVKRTPGEDKGTPAEPK